MASGSSTAIQGVVWMTQPVTITIAANVTEVETFYPGGGAPDYTTFTLTGPTTFITSYIDGIDVHYTYSTTLSTFTVASATTKTETLLASIDTSHLTGDYTNSNYPWEVETTFVLAGPTVYVTQGVTIGSIEEASPPYVLQSAPASNLDVTTTAASTASPTAVPSTTYTATVFNPRPASSSTASETPIATLHSNPASSLISQEQESSSFPIPQGATDTPSASGSAALTTPTSSPWTVHSSSSPLDSPNTLLPPAPLTIAGLPASALNPSALIIGSQTLTPDSPVITIDSIPISLNSAVIIAGSSTIPFPPPALTLSTPPVITIGTEPITLLPSAIAIAGTTLRPGATGITIDGIPISLDSTALVVGTETEVFLSPTQTESAGLAPLILSGLGQKGTSSSPPTMTSGIREPSYTPFAGGAQKIVCTTGWRRWALGLVAGVVLCC
ncbi:hypothetical protein MMC26_002348 [Xylographa opegraphella]|nr:hypothetical protein [Xylographa opegraphella]